MTELGGPVDRSPPPDLEARSQLLQALFAEAIKGIVDWPDEQAAEQISALLADERRVFGPDTGQPRPFLWDLIISRPALGAAMCAHAMSAPDSNLVSQMSITLIAMGKAGAPETIEWAQRLLADGRAELARQVGHALGLQRNRSELLPGEDELLRELAGHPDHVAAAATAGAARHLAAGHPDLALELIFTTLPNGGLREAVTIFGPQTFGILSWAQLPAGHKALILGQLAEYPSLDDYEIGQFLEHIAAQEPDNVVELLQNRVEDAEHCADLPMFSALPYTPLVSLPIRQSARFPDLLHRVREWLAIAPQSFKRATLGSELFAMIAGPFDDQVLDVVFDYTDNPDPVKMQVVATMLRSAPRELVWNTETVRRVLRAADRCGTDSLHGAQGALLRAASHDQRGATLGQPFAEDVELRDRSEALAATYLPGSVENQFFGLLAESTRRTIAWTLADDRPDDHRSWS